VRRDHDQEWQLLQMYELWKHERVLVTLNRHPEGGRFGSGVRLKDLVLAFLHVSRSVLGIGFSDPGDVVR
jgi:hypothetical protein